MSLRDEILEQPGAGAARRRRRRARRDRGAIRADRSTRSSSPPAARPTTPRSTRQYLFGAEPAARRARRAVARLALRRRAALRARRSSSASPSRARRRTSSGRRGGRAPGRADDRDHERPVGRSRAAAEHVIDLAPGPERAVAATKTYTAPLLAVALLSPAARRRAGRAIGARTRAVPDAWPPRSTVEPDVGGCRRARGRAGRHRTVRHRRAGFEYATAREWALKLKELGAGRRRSLLGRRLPARPAGARRARLPGPRDRARGAAPDGLSSSWATCAAAAWTRSSSPTRRGARPRPRSIAIPAGVPEWLRPVVSIVPAQLFAIPPDPGPRPRPGGAPLARGR